jgi:hypothetical protein
MDKVEQYRESVKALITQRLKLNTKNRRFEFFQIEW